MKKAFLLGIIAIFLVYSPVAYAESNYVLPYPSAMPGSNFYALDLAWEAFQKYWHFGNFSQFAYNLKLSDKYLVEAKILFEYKQYLLAHQAIIKSDEYFIAAYRFLGKAKQEGKNISQKEQVLKEAALKHSGVLEQIKRGIPQKFVWTPEKDKPTSLFLWKQIDEAVKIRKSCT